MGRRYLHKKADIWDIIPFLVGLIVLGIFFAPGLRQLLDGWFFPLLVLLGGVGLGLLIRAIWRRLAKEEPEEAIPTFIHSDEEREQFRAMMGVRQPPSSLKVVTPVVEIVAEGADTIPTCPNCGVRMVPGPTPEGSDDDSTFWICRNYPQCRKTFKLKRRD